MPKTKLTPGSAINALLKKHSLNYNRLAKAIGISSAMVRLIARDENPVSANVAFRLAKFFKNKPEYWLDLQKDFDIAKTAADKKLAKVLAAIPAVDKVKFERKKSTPRKKTKPAKKAKSAAGRRAVKGKRPAARKGVRGKAVAKKKTAGRKPARGRKIAAARKPAAKKGRKPAAARKPAAKKGKKPAAGKKAKPVRTRKAARKRSRR